jgi:hypothetical protein
MNERIILDIFFDKTNGSTWKNNSGWGVYNVGVCKYKGVQCNNSGQVVVLDLSNNGLIGDIPEEIRMLRHLRVLGKKKTHTVTDNCALIIEYDDSRKFHLLNRSFR